MLIVFSCVFGSTRQTVEMCCKKKRQKVHVIVARSPIFFFFLFCLRLKNWAVEGFYISMP